MNSPARRLGLALSGVAIATGTLLLPGVGPASAADPCTTAGATTTCTYAFTGAEQTFTVPSGITSIQVTATGASGGRFSGGPGKGAVVTASLPVTAGSTLFVEVGGTGADSQPASAPGGAGGFNGGGSGDGGDPGRNGMSGGGGASDIRTASGGADPSAAALGSRVLVAAGGGGDGQTGFGGSAGQDALDRFGGGGTGKAATATDGGAGGGAPATDGSSGQGGLGGPLAPDPAIAGAQRGGAGGGGGLFGGGGGSRGNGGGGGSSLVPPGGTFSIASATGPGSVVISYITPVATTTSLTSSPNPSTVGQTVTLSATVSGGDTAPTGTVAFFQDGTASLGSAPLVAGQASITTAALGVGNNTLTAVFTSDEPTRLGSTSTPVTQTVTKVASTTTLTAGPNPSIAGQAVTLTAAVTGSTPTGTVTFLDGGTTLVGVAAVTGGTATVTTTSLAVGGHTLTAEYSGDATNTGSTSGPVTQTVNAPLPASLAATSGSGQTTDVNTAFAQPLVATATDSSGAPTPDRAVTFTVTAGSASFGGSASAVATTGADGTATAPTLTAGATAGPVTVTASAPGASGTVSATFTLTVQPAPTTTVRGIATLTSGPQRYIVVVDARTTTAGRSSGLFTLAGGGRDTTAVARTITKVTKTPTGSTVTGTALTGAGRTVSFSLTVVDKPGGRDEVTIVLGGTTTVTGTVSLGDITVTQTR